jgi:hypothetical protein
MIIMNRGLVAAGMSAAPSMAAAPVAAGVTSLTGQQQKSNLSLRRDAAGVRWCEVLSTHCYAD